MNFEENQPIYQQIIFFIKIKLIIGEWKLNEKIPSVRDFAIKLNVNPNTVQRAYAELEREELIYSKRGMGSYVTTDRAKVAELSKKKKKKKVKQFIKEMRDMGFIIDEIIKLILKIEEEN